MREYILHDKSKCNPMVPCHPAIGFIDVVDLWVLRKSRDVVSVLIQVGH